LELVRQGTITASTLVRCGRDGLWQPLQDYPHFKPDLAASSGKPSLLARLACFAFALIGGAVVLFAVLMIIGKANSPRPAASTAATASVPASPTDTPASTSPGFVREPLDADVVIAISNNARARAGLPPLRTSSLLNSVAKTRAFDMIDKGYFGHVSPTGEGVSDVAQRIGYRYRRLSENIASGDFLNNQKIVNGWLQSPGHRANMLNPEVRDIGVAVLEDHQGGSRKYYAVQVFGLESPDQAAQASVPVTRPMQTQREHFAKAAPSFPAMPVLLRQSCVAPSKNLKYRIERVRGELSSMSANIEQMKEELETASEEIDSDRIYAARTSFFREDTKRELRAKAVIYNQKIQQYNRVIEAARDKRQALSAMVAEYNTSVNEYNQCIRSRTQ
jgi:uncharacterized protein YkwD